MKDVQPARPAGLQAHSELTRHRAPFSNYSREFKEFLPLAELLRQETLPAAEPALRGAGELAYIHPRTPDSGEASEFGPRPDGSVEDPTERAERPAWEHLAGLEAQTALRQTSEGGALTQRGVASSAHLAELIQSIAWGGDRRRGTARIELGAGRLAGTALVVAVDDAGLRLQVEAPSGVDSEALVERIRERLAARGQSLDEVSIR